MEADGGLHPLQQTFIELGAIQCGYCTPAMLLAGEELLERKGYNAGSPEPISEAEAREALSGILCRCTGYVKPVQAILRRRPACVGRSRPRPRLRFDNRSRAGPPTVWQSIFGCQALPRRTVRAAILSDRLIPSSTR